MGTVKDYPAEFGAYIARIVQEASIGNTLPTHLKYLKRYCKMVDCGYDDLLENINLLLELVREYRETESIVSLRIASYQAKVCYLPDGFIDGIITNTVSSDRPAAHSSYNARKGGGIFDEMPGGRMLDNTALAQ